MHKTKWYWKYRFCFPFSSYASLPVVLALYNTQFLFSELVCCCLQFSKIEAKLPRLDYTRFLFISQQLNCFSLLYLFSVFFCVLCVFFCRFFLCVFMDLYEFIVFFLASYGLYQLLCFLDYFMLLRKTNWNAFNFSRRGNSLRANQKFFILEFLV